MNQGYWVAAVAGLAVGAVATVAFLQAPAAPKPRGAVSPAGPAGKQDPAAGASEALFEKAARLQDEGKDREAIPIYEDLLRRNPGDADSRFNLAAALENEEDLDAALEEYLKVLEARPTHAESLAAASEVADELGHLQTALRLYRKRTGSTVEEDRRIRLRIGQIERELTGKTGPPEPAPAPDPLDTVIDELLNGE